MPTVSLFYGVAIRMFFADHNPPHFHAFFEEHQALVRISDGRILRGRLPVRIARLVEEWTELNREGLMENWARTRPGSDLPLMRIPGLDGSK